MKDETYQEIRDEPRTKNKRQKENNSESIRKPTQSKREKEIKEQKTRGQTEVQASTAHTAKTADESPEKQLIEEHPENQTSLGGAVGNPNTQTDKQGYYFQAANTSTQWELNNVIIRAEVMTLDNTVNNNIVKHLLDGQSLKLVFPMYHTLTQTFNAGGGDLDMNIVKSSFKTHGSIHYFIQNIKKWNYQC